MLIGVDHGNKLSTAQEVGDDPEMDDRMRSLIAGTLSAFRSRG